MKEDRHILARVLVLSIVAHGALMLAVIESYRLEATPYVGYPSWPGRHRHANPIESSASRPQFGEADGTGLSLASADLPTLLQARQAETQQPFLSLDPIGLAVPGPSTGDAAVPGKQAVPLPETLDDAPRDALPSTAIRGPIAPHRPARVLAPGERVPAEPESLASAAGTSSGSSEPASPAGSAGGRPADIAPRSDRVMDGFARVESAVMSPGGTVARQGRVIRFPRPLWNLGSYADVWSGVGLPIRFVIEMQLDANGRVRSARLLEGTGRTSIDRPILVAAHGAELDPSRDADGKPRADTIALVLTVR